MTTNAELLAQHGFDETKKRNCVCMRCGGYGKLWIRQTGTSLTFRPQMPICYICSGTGVDPNMWTYVE